MTTLAFIADVHVHNPGVLGGPMLEGLNRRGNQIVATLERAVRAAYEKDVDALVILGDLFDQPNPPAAVIAHTQAVLKPLKDDVIAIVGNHDMESLGTFNNATATIHPLGRIAAQPRVLRVGEFEVWCVPHQPGDASEWLPDVLSELEGRDAQTEPGDHPPVSGSLRVLALHLGIADDQTAPFLQGAHDSVHVKELWPLMEAYDIGFTLAGNWHTPKEWSHSSGRRIIQAGALCPTGFDNEGLGYGDVVFVGHDGIVSRMRVPGPRFFRVEGPRALTLAAGYAKARECAHPYVQWSVAAEHFAQAQQDVHQQGMLFEGVSLRRDRKETASRTASAVAHTQSAGTTQAALEAFVEGVDVPPQVLRANVLARCRKYLQLGEDS